MAEFEVSPETAARARELIEQAHAAELGVATGWHPEAVAGAALVVAADEAETDRAAVGPGEVAAAIEPTAHTLRNRREELRELIDERVPRLGADLP